MMTPYEHQIRPLAPGYDPRHIEAFMRVEHSTLDGLSPSRFRSEVRLAALAVDEGGKELAESVASPTAFEGTPPPCLRFKIYSSICRMARHRETLDDFIARLSAIRKRYLPISAKPPPSIFGVTAIMLAFMPT